MITNSDLFYSRAKEYQGKRAEIISTFEKRLAALESAKGSQYYTDEKKAAEDTRDAAIAALKGEYNEYFRIALDGMAKTNASRGIVPPTAEELRTLELLKMKEKLTVQECIAAANTLKGNVTCLAVLDEVAQGKGIMRSFASYAENKELAVEVVDGAIDSLRAAIRDFMDFDTTRAARIVQEHNERMYGTQEDAPPLRKRPLFEDKAGCFATLAGGLTGDTLTAFLHAVDGE